ncbi:hypothetical protein TCAL_07632 [Tigriopus californicus]|uniref:Trafficking protein particle complex subunit 11 n=1 Tax=Tigriopus californicus TaxID=6832 RepID=A0A553NVV1_TIGCA|nr:trafficking protein particle complex subunit 11-like [Tigriopus californicus]TRY69565.1 hypothetical protein TCAL_07632 [Tigriopus californicus]
MELSLPACLTGTPQGLVSLVGLRDYPQIMEHFRAENRSLDRVPLHFMPEDKLEWPQLKAKRSNYEWFIPKGILKRNWMTKHLWQIPSVVVIFMELDWSGPNFLEKKAECASRVQSVRSTLAGRATKLAVVLIQNAAANPVDEGVATEKAASVCSECELSARSLFVLPVKDDNLSGYILRLETAFYELSQNYYHQEIRGIKAHRDHLNKTTHLYLFVRHQFKAGFLNELKRDFHAAYKHYGQAYSLLMEVRATDTNIMEVKTVAGFISYKICKLGFRLNLPRDAISQFRKHMDIFQQKVGMEALVFEHKGWQSKQSEYFADVFKEAIMNGLPAIQTQHPGLYYQQAAQFAIGRREVAEELCSNLAAYPQPDPLASKDSLEFYGQRPWRPGKVALEAPDMDIENTGIQALLHHEKEQVQHSEIIIALLEKSIEQFSVYKSPRSQSHLRVTMAEELKSAQRYKESLDLLHEVMNHYRAEGWRPLLDAVLSLAVKCAFLLADVSEYVRLSLDLASVESAVGEDEKARIMQNVANILEENHPKVPAAEPGLTSKAERAAVGEATRKWAERLAKAGELDPIVVDLGQNPSAIQCKTLFVSSSCKADERVTFEVFVLNGGPAPLPLSKVDVITSNSNYKLNWSGFELVEPKRTFEKRFSFLPQEEDVNRSVQVKKVNMTIGHPVNSLQVVLSCAKSVKVKKENPFLANFIIPPKPKVVMPLSGDEVDGANFAIDLIEEVSTVHIKQRDPLVSMKLDYTSPVMVGEWFQIKILLHNHEVDSKAQGLEVFAALVEAHDPLIADTTRLTFDPKANDQEDLKTPSTDDKTFQDPLIKRLGDLNVDGQDSISLYVKASTTGFRGVTITTKYSVSVGDPLANCQSQISETLKLETIEPFQLDYSIQSIRMNTIKKVFTDETFLLCPQVKSITHHGIAILDSNVDIRPPMQLFNPTPSQLSQTNLYHHSIGQELYPLIVRRENLLSGLDVQELVVGKYTLKWCREGNEAQPHLASTTSFELPTVPVHLSSIFVSCDHPAFGRARSPFTLTYNLFNRTEKVQEYTLTIETSEAFMMSGNKQLSLKVFPMRTHSLSYILYPLVAGDNVTLPTLRLSSARVAQVQDANEVLDRLLPKTIVILPKTRVEEGSKAVDGVDSGEAFFDHVDVVSVKNGPFVMGAKLKAAS